MRFKHSILAFIALLCLGNATAGVAPDTSWTIKSPNGKLFTTLSLKGGNTCVQVRQEGNDMMYASPVSLTLADAKKGKLKLVAGEGVKRLPRVTIDTLRTDRATPLGRQARVTTKATRITLNFGDYDLIGLAANDGAAYRFVTRVKGQVQVTAEKCDLALPRDCSLWYQLVETYVSSFEGHYKHQPLPKVEQGILMAPQLLMTLANGKGRMLLSDYDVQDYPGLYWELNGNVLSSRYAAYPKQEVEAKNGSRLQVAERESYIALTQGTRAFPWKMMVVSRDDKGLLSTTLPVQLAPDSQISDPSWIKPGKASWEWWNASNLTGANFTTGSNDSTYMAYIDFAGRNHLQYVLIDAGWTAKEQPINLLKTNIDVERLVRYGAERGVGIILWADYAPFSKQMEQVVSHYAQLGVKGFKIDHMNRNDQKVVSFMWQAAQACAEHHMILDFHGTMPPTGLHYAWPNVLSFEAVHGLEYMKSEKSKTYQPNYDCTFPFIRQVVGPVDYTPGAMRNSIRGQFQPVSSQPMSQGTRAHQVAAYVVFESPLSMLCDAPSAYETPYNKPCLDFMSQIPTTWDETRVLKANIGSLIVVARRKGTTWWVAGITNWAARTDFLVTLEFAQGRHLTILSDGKNADRDASDYRIDEMELDDPKTTKNTLQLDMKPGGGFVAVVR